MHESVGDAGNFPGNGVQGVQDVAVSGQPDHGEPLGRKQVLGHGEVADLQKKSFKTVFPQELITYEVDSDLGQFVGVDLVDQTEAQFG